MKLHAVFSDHHSTQRVVTVTFPVVEGETVTHRFSLDLDSTAGIWIDRYRRLTTVNATWTELNRIVPEEDYPIILVHGILGGWNPEMMGLDGKTFPGLLGLIEPRQFNGSEWIELEGDSNFTRIREVLGEGNYYNFYYDWRESNSVSAESLKNEIDRIKSLEGKEKVQVIAHSMGGLVVRNYVQSNGYENDIRRIVFAGTPHQGATMAVPKWQFGDFDGGLAPTAQYMSALFEWLLTEWHPYKDSDLTTQDKLDIIKGHFEYRGVQGVYSIGELQATYPSLIYQKLPFEFERSVENPFLENLNRSNNLENLYGIDTLFVVGNKNSSTPSFYKVGLDSEDQIQSFIGFDRKVAGDGTVTLDSATISCENGTKLSNQEICTNKSGGTWERQDITDSAASIKVNESAHNGLPSAACSEIFAFLNMSADGCPAEDSLLNNFRRILIFSIASPADIEVVTPSGKVFNNAQTNEYYQAESAMYLSLGEERKKLIMMPFEEEGEYQVNLTGTGNGGEYEVITWYQDEDQSFDISEKGSIEKGGSKEYKVNIESDEEGKVVEGSAKPVKINNRPAAILDQGSYQGVEESEMVFDGSNSTDEDGDNLQYQWTITASNGNELVRTDYTDESIFVNTFDKSFEGEIVLTVTDGELESSTTANISIRTMNFNERVEQIRQLLESLEEDTSYIRVKKQLWTQLIDLLDLPQVQNSDKLKEIILNLLESDIRRSLEIDSKLESSWIWWQRRDLISDSNERILRNILIKVKHL